MPLLPPPWVPTSILSMSSNRISSALKFNIKCVLLIKTLRLLRSCLVKKKEKSNRTKYNAYSDNKPVQIKCLLYSYPSQNVNANAIRNPKKAPPSPRPVTKILSGLSTVLIVHMFQTCSKRQLISEIVRCQII